MSEIDIEGGLIIAPSNHMQGVFLVSPASSAEIAGSITVSHRNSSSIEANLTIAPANQMFGTFNVLKASSSEITGELVVQLSGHSDAVSGTIVVKPVNQMFGRFTLVYNDQQDKQANIHVQRTETNDLPGSVSVSPWNVMYGRVDTIQPPKVTVKTNPAKDAFVRSRVPTFNYGHEQTMLVGHYSALNETYRSFIGFDLTTFMNNPNFIIESATLRVFTNTINGVTSDLVLRTAVGSWDEDNLTWANQPFPGAQIRTGQVGTVSGYLTYDVLNTVKSWAAESTPNYGFLLKALDEASPFRVQFNTRENSYNKPELVITYYDSTPTSVGQYVLQGSIEARQAGQDDVVADIVVQAVISNVDVEGAITVRDPGQVDASILVSQPTMTAELLVQQSNWSDIAGSLDIRLRNNQVDILGTITLRSYDGINVLNGALTVPYRDEIPGSVTVRRSRSVDVTGSLKVKQIVVLPAEIYIRGWGSEELPASIGIQASDSAEIYGSITIPSKVDLLASIQPVIQGNLLASILIETGRHSEITAEVIVQQNFSNDLFVSIQPVLHSELSASINIIGLGLVDVGGSINVVYFDVIPASLIVQQNSTAIMNGSVTARRTIATDLPTSIFPRYASDLSGYVEIRQSDAGDLAGNLTVRLSDSDDLPASLTLILGNYLDSSVTVRQSTVRNLGGSMKVRKSAANDLFATLAVAIPNDITGAITVRGYVAKDLRAYITVRDPDAKSDIASVITVRTRKSASLPGSLSVRRSLFRNLSASLRVRVPGQGDLPVTIAVKQVDDLPTTITIPYRSDLSSDMHIRVGTAEDVPGELEVSPYHVKFLQANITIKSLINASRRNGRIVVRQTQDSEIVGSVTVRHSDTSQVNGDLIVPYRKDINGAINIIGASVIPGSIFVISGFLHATIFVPTHGLIEISGDITVRVRFLSEIVGTIRVGGGSRAYAFIM